MLTLLVLLQYDIFVDPVFYWTATSTTESSCGVLSETKLSARDGASRDWFGYDVSISGEE
jgi:hypothetical protein